MAVSRDSASQGDARAELISLVKELALQFGDFTLASGKKASFYLDCRKVSLHGRGARLIGELMLDELAGDLPDAVGGMAIGADPITAAVITVADYRQTPLRGFIVRKEAKAHGTGKDVEGPVAPGQRVVIVEDTVTTGGSSLKAIEKAEAFGLKVVSVLAVVDRLEGGEEMIRAKGYGYKSLLTVRDLGVEPVKS
jgi:orotate phosphoribosyltransferase